MPPRVAISQKPKSPPVAEQRLDHHEILQKGRTSYKELTDQILFKSEDARGSRQRLKLKTKIIASHYTYLILPQNFTKR